MVKLIKRCSEYVMGYKEYCQEYNKTNADGFSVGVNICLLRSKFIILRISLLRTSPGVSGHFFKFREGIFRRF